MRYMNMSTKQKLTKHNFTLEIEAETPEEAEHYAVQFMRAAFREFAGYYGVINYEWEDNPSL
jgi:hypothetical protein